MRPPLPLSSWRGASRGGPASIGNSYDGSTTTLADITDSTGNTEIFGQKAHGMLLTDDQPWYHWWASGDRVTDDTLFLTWHGVNGWKKARWMADG